MRDWFTVEQLEEDTYAISEYRHWEQAHSYLLCGSDAALLIDTGLGVSNLRTVVDWLTTLPLTVATTHVHWDHIGSHGFFDKIAVHQAEKDWLSHSFPIPLEAVKKNLLRDPCEFPPEFYPDDYRVFQGEPQLILKDGDSIDLGSRTVKVLHTPGHSPGHCCFYEPERQLLFSGDLVYSGCLDAFYPSTDPLLFYQSVKRVSQLPVHRIFPGHYCLKLSSDLIGRIEKGFSELEQKGMLRQGSGIFEFEDFQIHI